MTKGQVARAFAFVAIFASTAYATHGLYLAGGILAFFTWVALMGLLGMFEQGARSGYGGGDVGDGGDGGDIDFDF